MCNGWPCRCCKPQLEINDSFSTPLWKCYAAGDYRANIFLRRPVNWPTIGGVLQTSVDGADFPIPTDSNLHLFARMKHRPEAYASTSILTYAVEFNYALATPIATHPVQGYKIRGLTVSLGWEYKPSANDVRGLPGIEFSLSRNNLASSYVENPSRITNTYPARVWNDSGHLRCEAKIDKAAGTVSLRLTLDGTIWQVNTTGGLADWSTPTPCTPHAFAIGSGVVGTITYPTRTWRWSTFGFSQDIAGATPGVRLDNLRVWSQA